MALLQKADKSASKGRAVPTARLQSEGKNGWSGAHQVPRVPSSAETHSRSTADNPVEPAIAGSNQERGQHAVGPAYPFNCFLTDQLLF